MLVEHGVLKSLHSKCNGLPVSCKLELQNSKGNMKSVMLSWLYSYDIITLTWSTKGSVAVAIAARASDSGGVFVSCKKHVWTMFDFEGYILEPNMEAEQKTLEEIPFTDENFLVHVILWRNRVWLDRSKRRIICDACSSNTRWSWFSSSKGQWIGTRNYYMCSLTPVFCVTLKKGCVMCYAV